MTEEASETTGLSTTITAIAGAIVVIALVGVLGLVTWGTLWVWSQVF